MSVDLVLDLVRGIRHVDRRIGVRGGHLGLSTLERWQEFAVQETWLGVFELVRDVSSKSELVMPQQVRSAIYIYRGKQTRGFAHVRVLINGTRNQTGNVVLLAKDLGEGVRERRSCLDGDEMVFADVVAVAGQCDA